MEGDEGLGGEGDGMFRPDFLFKVYIWCQSQARELTRLLTVSYEYQVAPINSNARNTPAARVQNRLLLREAERAGTSWYAGGNSSLDVTSG